MFKLESYVTPIILNHIAKYVKDIKPEDAQVSLWEGEVCFQNLELRLDVLEEELNLPIELKTGHIHDLTIQVPWTRIKSEPIKIIINTIEFVVKLRKDDGTPMPTRQKVEVKRDETEPQQQSMIMGLVNKIINNINVEFQNIIFKFVDDEFVVSMNIQSLMLSAANEEWQSAMVDINPVKVVLRKLVQLKDLTICLDQLNEAGEIDVCHEPILFRCSLQCRFLRKYHANTAKTTSTTRIGILTKSLDLLASSLQFPLAMKIFDLVSDISRGNIKIKKVYEEETIEGAATEAPGSSYLSWAWNMLPSLNFSYSNKDDEDETPQEGHVFDIGVYFEAFNLTFKNSEYIHDAIVGGIKRIRYHPIMKISFGGLYFEQQSNQEKDWFCVKSGVSKFCIEPLGVYKNERTCINLLEGNTAGTKNNFTDMSLFDKRFQLSDKYWVFANLEDYNNRISDKYLLSRSPIFAFDLVKFKEIFSLNGPAAAPIDPQNPTECPKQIQFRLLSSGMTFRYNQHLQQVKHIITDLLNNYKYSAYHADQIDAAGSIPTLKETSSSYTSSGSTTSSSVSTLTAKTLEEIESIMKQMPKVIYKFHLENLRIEFHAQTEPLYDASKGAVPNVQSVLTNAEKDNLPYFTFQIDLMKGNFSKPNDLVTLVNLITNLREKPLNLIEGSYECYDFVFKETTLRMQYPGEKTGEKLAYIPLLEINSGTLIEPKLWRDEEAAAKKLFIKCNNLNVSFFKRQIIHSYRLYNLIGNYDPTSLLSFAKNNQQRFNPEEQIFLKCRFNGLHLTKLVFKEHLIWYATLKCVTGDLWDASTKEYFHIFDTKNLFNDNEIQWLEAQFQQPLSEEAKGDNTQALVNYALGIWVFQYRLSIDQKLLDFLKYRDIFEPIPDEAIPMESEIKITHYHAPPPSSSTNTNPNYATASNISLTQNSSTTNRRFGRANSVPRKISYPEETIHLSSDRDEVIREDSACPKTESMLSVTVTDPSAKYTNLLKLLKRCIFNIEVDCGKIDIADELKLTENHRRVGDYIQIRFGKFAARSELHNEIICGDLTKKISHFLPDKNDFNAYIAFTNSALRCRESNKSVYILDNFNVTFSLYFEHKIVKLPIYFITKELREAVSDYNYNVDIDDDDDYDSDSLLEEQEEEELPVVEEVETENRSKIRKQVKLFKPKRKNFKLVDIFPRDSLISNPHRRRSKKRNELSINVHIDIQKVHIYAKKLKKLHQGLNILYAFKESLSCSPLPHQKPDVAASDPIQIVTSNEKNALLDEFMQADMRVNQVSYQTIEEVKFHHLLKVSVFGQCSIEKVAIELENSTLKPSKKLIFIIEDILSTLDKQPHYFKCTAKFGNLSLDLVPIATDKLVCLDDIRIKMINNEIDNTPMGNLVYTAVDMDTLYEKLDIKVRSSKLKSSDILKEAIINIQEIEIMLQIEAVHDFLSPTSPLYELVEIQRQKPLAEPKEKAVCSVLDLPIIHVDCRGISCFLILIKHDHPNNLAILKIERIIVTPYLENPLERNAIRPDVYSKASVLGIVGVPGSIIENRQYELSFKKISAFTGSWYVIQQYMKNASKTTNPAFEWNNQTQDNDVLPLRKIFEEFNVICTYAPCIVYKNILICGEAIEFNCASDFIAYINTSQLSLLSGIVTKLKAFKELFAKQISTQNSSSSMYSANNCSMKESTSEPITNREKKGIQSMISVTSSGTVYQDAKDLSSVTLLNEVKSDSGYSSKLPRIAHSVASNIRRISKVSLLPSEKPKRKLPYSMSLVAGKFIFHFFHYKKHHDVFHDHGHALLSIGFSEPSFLFKQNIYDSSTQVSLFDLVLSIANLKTNELSEDLVSTSPGRPNSSGIPSPLFTFKSTETKQKLSEVEIEISKAIIFNHHEDYIIRFFDNLLILQKALNSPQHLTERPSRPIPKGSKIQLIKEKFLNADRMHVACQRLEFIFSDEKIYKCRFVLADMGANVKFFRRPEKASIKACVGSAYLQTDQQIFLHPVIMKVSADFIREPWYRLPLILSTVKFNVLHIDVSTDLILQFQEALKGVRKVADYCSNGYAEYLKKRAALEEGSSSKTHLTSLKVIKSDCDVSHKKKEPLHKKEFYQDDLRAGAFQFVEVSTDAVLPLPYQIQIIKKDFGIICWRYPQPRKMYKVHVYPVPMETEYPVQIKCRMEYYNELFKNFVYYCEFCLTQNNTTEVILPDHEVCATIWRVVIMQSLVAVNGECFRMDDEDEELQSIPSYTVDASFNPIRSDRDFVLHPKVLVACMRVDTTFQPQSIPKVQLLVSCNVLLMKLLNAANDRHQLPIDLQGLRQKKTTTTSQNILELFIEQFDFCSTFYNTQYYTLDSSLTARIRSLDLGFLNMLPIVEPTKIQFYAAIDKEKHKSLANIMIEKMCLNLGPSVLQTLLTSKKYWDNFFEVSSHVREVVMSKCVIVNLTDVTLSFGQSGTHEKLDLAPNCFYYYHFCSEKFGQELTFSVIEDSLQTKPQISSSVPIPFKFDGEFLSKCVQIGNKCLSIRIQKISATQVLVHVKGQVEIMSMVPHDLLVQFRYEGNSNAQQPRDSIIPEKSKHSFFLTVQRTTNINLRLKIMSPKGKGRTGDIPLKLTKNLPWLVKVPVETNEFISFWVRILREDVNCIQDLNSTNFFPQKILILIWPVFQIENLLNTSIHVVEASTNTTYKIEGKGESEILNVPATNISEHNVNFQLRNPVNPDDPLSYTLMLKALDWHELFQYDEKAWRIENAIQKLSQSEKRKWPMDNPEEIRINRSSQNVVPSNISYTCRLSNEFACSMSLIVRPWGLFINASGLDISLCDIRTKKRQNVASNNLEMMPSVEKAFTIDIQRGTDWYSSTPINIQELLRNQLNNKDRTSLTNGFTTELTIILENVIVCFVLLYLYENELKVFKLSSKYVVSNFLKDTLCLLPFAMDHKENSNREELTSFDKKVPKFHVKSSENEKNCRLGLTLDAFFDLKASKTRRTKDTAFVFFVCLKSKDDAQISIPIPLVTPFTRRCISLQSGSDSIPLIISLLEKDKIFYLNISRDISPAFLICNRTDVALITAQTSASENSQVTNTTPEYEGRYFEWFHMVPAISRSYYTPPDLSFGFPNSDTIMCNLSLALFKINATKKNLKWSKPIRTDNTWQKFLHLPGHGDIKILICDKHRVTRISIFYVSDSEFSVKDLRSRLISRSYRQQQQQSDSNLQIITEEDPKDCLSAKRRSLIETKENPLNDLKNFECQHFCDNIDPKTTSWKISFYAKELSLTLHTEDKDRDCIKQEVISMHIDDLAIAYDENNDEREVNVVMPNVQVDNQMYSLGKYDFPVVLCSQDLYERKAKTIHIHDLKKVYKYLAQSQPMFSFQLKLYADEFVLSSVHCKVNPLRIYIEDSFVNDFLEALVEYSQIDANSNQTYDPNRYKMIELAPGECLLPENIVNQILCIAEPLKLRLFVIEPLNVLLSVHTSVRLYIALDHSPLSFSKYERQHILTTPIRFGQSLGLHYLSGAIFGAGWVVGSLEILGSPSGLARSVTTGLKDFVSMPVEGLFRGPWGFLVGITQGSASLFRNITAGTVNSVTKLASSVARNLDRLSLDREHIERTEALRRSRPQGLTEGFSQGLTGFGISLLGAVGGIAHHTLEANSAVEVLTGISKGLVGAITKPLSGAAELLALTGQGMLHTVGFNALPLPVAPSVPNTINAEPSAYRIWKLLPSELVSDQVLIYNEVTLLKDGKMKKAYAFLTLTIFAIIEAEWDKLAFALPVDKVDIRCDKDDKSLLYVRMVKIPQDDLEERHNYTNERIMNFLQSSEHSITTNSLHELLRLHQENSFIQNDDWSFYIDSNLGEHLIQYINIMKTNISYPN